MSIEDDLMAMGQGFSDRAAKRYEGLPPETVAMVRLNESIERLAKLAKLPVPRDIIEKELSLLAERWAEAKREWPMGLDVVLRRIAENP